MSGRVNLIKSYSWFLEKSFNGSSIDVLITLVIIQLASITSLPHPAAEPVCIPPVLRIPGISLCCFTDWWLSWGKREWNPFVIFTLIEMAEIIIMLPHLRFQPQHWVSQRSRHESLNQPEKKRCDYTGSSSRGSSHVNSFPPKENSRQEQLVWREEYWRRN